MDEALGSENFISLISIRKLTGVDSTLLPATTDFVLFYGKDKAHTKYRPVFVERIDSDAGAARYDQVILGEGRRRALTPEEKNGLRSLPRDARRYQLASLTSDEYRPDTTVGLVFEGRSYHPGANAHWKTSVEGIRKLGLAERVEATSGGTIRYRRMIDDFPATEVGNLWYDISGSVQSRSDPKVYVVQTSAALIQRCILMSTDPGDLVLDPTCGSGTTAYVAEQWGRRWITIDTSRVALALARTRLMSARYPYYLLADSPEGLQKEAELTGQELPGYPTAKDIRQRLRLQARSPRHAQVDRQQSRHQGRHDPRRDRRRDRPPCRDRNALRSTLRR